jgi:hypothetical protein
MFANKQSKHHKLPQLFFNLSQTTKVQDNLRGFLFKTCKTIMDNYTQLYTDLIQKHLNRQLTETDGYIETEIVEVENRLALKLPQSMRDLYRVAGNVYNELMDFVYLVDPYQHPEIVGDDFLAFMEESQLITILAIQISELTNSDPEVWIIDYAESELSKWLSIKVPFSEFIVRLVNDQAFMDDIMEQFVAR